MAVHGAPIESSIRIFDRSRDLASRQFFPWSEFSPVKVDAEIKVKSEAKLSAKLKLSEGELEGSTGTQSDFIIYQPVITAFNQGPPGPPGNSGPRAASRCAGSRCST